MKVIINTCYGGFSLSDEAILECVKRGMTLTTYDSQGNYVDPNADFVDFGKKDFGNRYSVCSKINDREIRCHPTLIAVIQELDKKANGLYAKLKIIDIPFDSFDGWLIDEHDGYESIKEEHREWN